MRPLTRRRLELLVPAGVTFCAVVVGVVLSPWIGAISALNQPCSLRALTGWPCLACGGTRSVQALAAGEVITSLKFNPLVFLAICAAGVWFVCSLWRAWRAVPVSNGTVERAAGMKSRKLRWWLFGLAALAVANWIYLVNYLPA